MEIPLFGIFFIRIYLGKPLNTQKYEKYRGIFLEIPVCKSFALSLNEIFNYGNNQIYCVDIAAFGSYLSNFGIMILYYDIYTIYCP